MDGLVRADHVLTWLTGDWVQSARPMERLRYNKEGAEPSPARPGEGGETKFATGAVVSPHGTDEREGACGPCGEDERRPGRVPACV